MFGVTGNVWRDGKCLAIAPTRQDSQPVKIANPSIAQPVVKCLGVTGNVWRDGKCLARAPTRQDSQPVDGFLGLRQRGAGPLVPLLIIGLPLNSGATLRLSPNGEATPTQAAKERAPREAALTKSSPSYKPLPLFQRLEGL